jgi:hypothetical protein
MIIYSIGIVNIGNQSKSIMENQYILTTSLDDNELFRYELIFQFQFFRLDSSSSGMK